MKIQFLAASLALLLIPAAAFSTVSRSHATSRRKTHSRKVLSRFAKVRRRIPLRRSSHRSTAASSRRRRGGRYSHHTSRYSRLRTASRRPSHPRPQIQPARAGQIQQALIQAGDLHGEPTGQWDAQTRQAMKLYQKQNGFAATGLPDAKSLMKMGLGPHPLPPQADPRARSPEYAQGANPPVQVGGQAQQAAAANPGQATNQFPPQ